MEWSLEEKEIPVTNFNPSFNVMHNNSKNNDE